MNPPIVSDKYLFNSYTPRKRLPYTPRKQSIGSSHSELAHIPWSTKQKLQESHKIDGLKKFVANRWSVCGKSVVWRRCLLGLVVERERQRIGKGRLDGLGVELPWVWLACRGRDWGGAGRKVMAEYSWKGKRGKKRQSRVGRFCFWFWFYCFWFYFFIFNAVLTWKIGFNFFF